MTSRTILLSRTALVGLALAACTPGSTTSTTVEQALARAGSILSALAPAVALIPAFVPGAAAFVPAIEAGLSLAQQAIDGLSATVSATTAQTAISGFLGAMGPVLTAAGQATALIGDPKARQAALAVLASVQGEVALLAQFATGAAPLVGARPAGSVNLRVRRVGV